LWVINADAEVLRLAVCKLNPARYGTAEDVMTASLNSRTQQVLAAAGHKAGHSHGGKQAVWRSLQEHVWHGMIS